MSSRKELAKEIRSNPRFVRLRNNFDSLPMYQLPLDDYHKEVITYHKARSIQRLNNKSPDFIDSVVEACTTDISTRSRMTYITIVCVKSSKSLDLAIDLLSDYLMSNYSDKIKKIASTISERQKFIDSVLRDFKEYVRKVETLKLCCELLVKDIDQSSYQMKMIVETFRIDRKPETRL
jgi:hypothetical protein